LAAALAPVAFHGAQILPFWWYFATQLLQGCYVFVLLSIVRLHGYRFGKSASSP
jgi:hypothetical protein